MEFGVVGFGESVPFAGAVEAEDVLEAVADAVACSGGFDEVVCQGLVLGRLVVQGRHVVHVELLEAFVEEVDVFGLLVLVARRLHDLVGNFHVREGVKHGDFGAEKIVVVDRWRSAAAEFMGNGGVVLVGEVLDGFVLGHAVLVLSQTGMLD